MTTTTDQLYVWTLTRMNPEDNVAPGDIQEMQVVAYDLAAARQWAYRQAVRTGNQRDERVWLDGDEFTLRILCLCPVTDTAAPDAPSGMVLDTYTWGTAPAEDADPELRRYTAIWHAKGEPSGARVSKVVVDGEYTTEDDIPQILAVARWGHPRGAHMVVIDTLTPA